MSNQNKNLSNRLPARDLALYMALGVFLCNIDLNNFKSVYSDLNISIKLNDTDIPENIAVWEPFENHSLLYILTEIDQHSKFFEETIIYNLE